MKGSWTKEPGVSAMSDYKVSVSSLSVAPGPILKLAEGSYRITT